MGKLHQTLAVEDALTTRFKQVIEEGINTFSKHPHLFQGLVTRQESRLEKEHPKYAEFPDNTETVPVATTVEDKLNYIFDVSSEYFDAAAQKDLANTKAKADLIIDGLTLLTDVPATTLLFIENKFKVIRNLLGSIKTLDQAKIWSTTPTKNVFTAPETFKVIKETVKEWRIVAPATEKHPAQSQLVEDNQLRAVKYITEMSGLISSAQLSSLLKKCDKLINAAKTARQTANDVDIIPTTISKPLFKYLMS